MDSHDLVFSLTDNWCVVWDPSLVRKDGFKLEGGEFFKEGFRKLFKTRMNLSLEPNDSAIQLAKTASKSCSTRKTIGCFIETIGCLYQQTTNKLNLKS